MDKLFMDSVVKNWDKARDWLSLDSPWYTSTAVSFLREFADTSDYVFEWGGGKSTPWWLDRCSRVTLLEAQPEWVIYILAHVTDRLDRLQKLDLRFAPAAWNPNVENPKSVWASHAEQFGLLNHSAIEKRYLSQFDDSATIAVVDGAIRRKALVRTLMGSRSGAIRMIVVDNTESSDFSNFVEVSVDLYNSTESDDLRRFVRADFAETEVERIPIHQNGSHFTSLLIRKSELVSMADSLRELLKGSDILSNGGFDRAASIKEFETYARFLTWQI